MAASTAEQEGVEKREYLRPSSRLGLEERGTDCQGVVCGRAWSPCVFTGTVGLGSAPLSPSVRAAAPRSLDQEEACRGSLQTIGVLDF